MAVDKGYLGSAYIGANKVSEINNWGFNPEAGIEEITAFGDVARRRTYTIKDVSGSFSGNADKSDTNGQRALIDQFLNGGTPAAVFLYLYVSGAEGYYGEALVTPTQNADATGLQTVDFAFVGTGEWYQNFS